MLDRERAQDERVRVNRPKPDGAEPRAEGGGGPPIVSALGNARVQRLLRSSEDQDPLATDDVVAGAIEAERGGGRALDGDSAQRFSGQLGADLGDVRVHDDSTSDVLNEAVRAEAFTTGSDIFFAEGKYQPGTAAGDELLAHELTHVVQQRDAPAPSGGGLDVSDPADASEREAASVAQQLTAPGAGIDRQPLDEEEEMLQTSLDRQPLEEEEEMLQTSLDRQPLEEEELLQTSLDRQPLEEEELLQTSLDRQPLDEEEELAME